MTLQFIAQAAILIGVLCVGWVLWRNAQKIDRSEEERMSRIIRRHFSGRPGGVA